MSLLEKLKQRKLVQWALAYLAGAWVLLQVLGLASDSYGFSHLVMQLAFGIAGLGFVIMLVLAWYHGERGAQKVSGAELLILALLFVIGGGVLLHMGGHASSSKRIAKIPDAPRQAIPKKSIAVMPFADNSDQSNQRYFSDGLSESLIIALSQYPALVVIGRESSFQLRDANLNSMQIGAKLRVAHLVEGSVSRDGDEVRIRAELVNTKDGRTVWSNQYDRPYKNLFALQDAITRAVADALKAELLGNDQDGAVAQTDRPPSGSLPAYNAYLEGNFYFNQYTQSSLREAIKAYQAAVAADPKYAAAYAGLSDASTYLATGFLSGPALEKALAQARSTADTAIKLNPNSAAAYMAQSLVEFAQFEWIGAETAARHALTLSPGSPKAKSALAYLLAALGHLDEAIRLERGAIKISPINARYYYFLGRFEAGAGDLDAAAQSLERATGLNSTASHYQSELALIQALRGNTQAAIAAANAEPHPMYKLWGLALAYHAAGEKLRAQKALKILIDQYADSSAYQIAQVYGFMGQPDQAFAWLDRAWRQRDPGIVFLLFDPVFTRYQSDPRFVAFRHKVGLPMKGETAVDGSATTHSGAGS
jgi:serine/threonine-protein kinase